MNNPVPDPLEESTLRRIPLETVILAAILALPAAFLFDPLTGLLFLAGGALSAAGFIGLKNAVTRFVGSDPKKALSSALLVYGLRLLLILAVFSIIIFLFSKKIFAFAAGFSTIIAVFFVESVSALSRMRKWKN